MFVKGLNPGFIEPTPFYQTTNPVQSQYYYGSHGFQAGPTFNSQQYNTVAAAPKTPFGLREMYRPLTAEQIMRMQQGRPYTAGPVAPTT
jgi:hypothetical protein